MKNIIRIPIYVLCLLITIAGASASWIYPFMEDKGGLYYPFDNSLNSIDLGNGSYTCTIVNAPTFSNATNGVFVNNTEPYVYGRYNWDGVANSCSITTDSALDIVPSESFYLSAWFKWEDTGTANIMFGSIVDGPGFQFFTIHMHWLAGSNTVQVGLRSNDNSNEKNFASTSTVNDGNLHHMAFSYNGTGDNHVRMWVDNVLEVDTTDATGWTISTPTLWMGKYSAGLFYDGDMDQLLFQKQALDNYTAGLLYNITAQSNITIPPPVIKLPQLRFNVTDFFNDSVVNNVTIKITNSTHTFTNSSGPTGVNFHNFSIGGNYSINITTEGMFYFNESNIIEFNESLQADPENVTLLSSRAFRFQDLYNISFSQNISNWVRTLNYSISLSCVNDVPTNIMRIVNNTRTPLTPNCVNRSIITYKGQYTPTIEGNYTIRFELNSSYGPSLNRTTGQYNFTADINNPVISALNITAPGGFGNNTVSVTLRCEDNIYPNLTYQSVFNSNTIFSGVLNRSTNQTNLTNIVQGNNELTGYCSDLFGTTTNTTTKFIYFRSLILIDERNNIPFDISNVSIARVYYDDNSSFFDFKDANTSEINLTAISTPKLRFEIGYSTGAIVTRYVDISIGTGNLRVCANPEDVTHFEQLMVSSTNRPVTVKNIFSQCVVAEDYTRFAFQDSLSLRFFSIAMPYYLYVYDGDTQTFLASIDGGLQQSYINLDTLEFGQNVYALNVLGAALTFQKTGNDTILIYYEDLGAAIDSLDVTITRADNNSIVFNTNSFTNPNKWNIVFNYSALGNITDLLVFKIDLDGERSNGLDVDQTKYFNIFGSVGTMPSAMAFVLGFFVMLFGLTFAASNLTFSWFGIIILIISEVMFSMGARTWYLTFGQGVAAILLIYVGISLLQKNSGEIA